MLDTTHTDVDTLFASGHVVNLLARVWLLQEYDAAKSMYLIDRTTSKGHRQIINLLFPGNIVGHNNHNRYHYSVQTLTEATVREIPAQAFIDTMTSLVEVIDSP